MTETTILRKLETRAGACGLDLRGAFHPEPEDEVLAGALESAGTLVLLGYAGSGKWKHFEASDEAKDGQSNPLDRWSRRVIDGLAAEFRAIAVYPFPTDRPPWFPFQRWAQRAEVVYPSPLRILIHPDWGLWHSYRGALAFTELLTLPPRETRPNPCDSCTEKPCSSACPAGAFTRDGFNDAACAAHLDVESQGRCLTSGCLARLACPIGVPWRYTAEQSSFHLEAFLARRVAFKRNKSVC